MVCDGVVDNAELARSPTVGALVAVHEGCQRLNHFLRQGRVVTEADGLAIDVSLVDPAGVGCDDLVEESFVAVR